MADLDVQHDELRQRVKRTDAAHDATRALVDALARDVVEWMEWNHVTSATAGEKRRAIIAGIRSRHAAPEAVEAGKRWYVVDSRRVLERRDDGIPFDEASATLIAGKRDAEPQFAHIRPILAILAVDADDARRQYRERTGATATADITDPVLAGVIRAAVDAYQHQTQPTPPAADAGTRLLERIQDEHLRARISLDIADLARAVVAERDEWHKKFDKMADSATVAGAQRDAAERTVAALRELCEEAAIQMSPTSYVHIEKLVKRLRAAAEGASDA